jgi:glucosamine--fructose-6-phosphate aminotransferase (isomerizing)
MCGIAGYVGSRSALPILLDSLGRLEYRGYDSCGVAVLDKGGPAVYRAVGRVDQLLPRISPSISGGYVGMAHTRWATHGSARETNAHPLASCRKEVLVVHNGIIENAGELREELQRRAHRFESDTDSEVIPHLLEEGLARGESLGVSMLGLAPRLVGSYAILAARPGEEALYALRYGAPLVIGVGDGEFFPASDIPSFLPMTRRVLYLHEGECARVTRKGVRLLHRDVRGAIHRKDPPSPSFIDLEAASVGRGGFDHYMIKEILDQAGMLERRIAHPDPALRDAVDLVKASEHVYLVGAGTSFHAALYGEALWARTAHRRSQAVISSEFENLSSVVGARDLVIALSQSGETADTLNAARVAKERGARLLAVVNQRFSTLSRLSDLTLPLGSGVEMAVAATKTYTAQLALLLQLASGLSQDGPNPLRELWKARDSIYHLTSEAAREHCRAWARRLATPRDLFLIGRGLQRVTALEAALKLKEVALLRAEAFPGGEMKHGPLALVSVGTPVVMFYGAEDQRAAESSARELEARGAVIHSVGPTPLSVSVEHIRVEEAGLANPISQMVPLQILAYEMARTKDLDPDRPRNLAKAVTVA